MPLEKNWLDPTAYEYFKQQTPPKGGFKGWHERTAKELAVDVNFFRDLWKKQIGVNDVLRNKINQDDERFKRWRKYLSLAIGGTWAAILWLIVHLLPYVVKGMAK